MPEPSDRKPNTPAAIPLGRRLSLPALSGKWSAIVFMASFGLASALTVYRLHLAPWIELEAVVALWWLCWVVVLSIVTYRGARVSDDHTLGTPQTWESTRWLGWAGEAVAQAGLSGGGEGCLFGILLAVLLVLAFAVVWLAVEVIIPLLGVTIYMLIHRMLARATRNQVRCRGRLLPSLGWGLVWATAYSVPLAGLVLLFHSWVKH